MNKARWIRLLLQVSIISWHIIAWQNISCADDRNKAAVLNFEGDVIEGQKKTPEIFLQTEVERPSIETILYQRKDFNEFHLVDSKHRPRLPNARRIESQHR